MQQQDERQRKHKRTKMILRIIGLVLLLGGLTLAIIGAVDFFSKFGDHGAGMPKKFWMMMVGMPMAAIGLALTLISKQKEIARYMKNESTPIFNEMGQEITPGITAIGSAIGSSVRGEGVICPNCGSSNAKDAVYCSKCATKLQNNCPSCGTPNDAGARFCKNCGTRLTM